MRVPKVEHYKDVEGQIRHVKYNATILIPRHPVITNDKQRKKCIDQIEKKCRTSMEYGNLVKYLKTNMEMDKCTFFPNVKMTKGKKAIEIHHCPFDLMTITDIITKKFEKENGYINQNLIAEEVMRCHYRGLIGLIPLSITAHQLYHDGKLIIPLNCVYGRFVEFTNEYYEYIDDVVLDMLEQQIEQSRNLTKEDLSVLNVAYVYSDTDGKDLPKELPEEDIKDAISLMEKPDSGVA